MARIRRIYEEVTDRSQVHTEVDCRVQLITTAGGSRLLQMDTFGSDNRESEPKVSQTIQFDETHASQLVELIRKAFPAIK